MYVNSAPSQPTLDEQVRSNAWENIGKTLLTDLRYALRQLRSNPGFAVISILTLALGIGASTAIFSAVNPILFEPLPYPHADRLSTIWEMRNDGGRNNGTFGSYRGMVERSHSFESLAVLKLWQPTITGTAQPERLDGQRVSASYFHVLRVSPLLGRNFQDSDDQLNGPKVVILSDALWRRRFGADNAIIGKQIKLDDDNYSVIGVMPGTFENVLSPKAEIWAPLQYDASLPADGREWGHHLRTIGRLVPGITREQASRELDVILHGLMQTYPQVHGFPSRFSVNSMQDDVTSAVRPALLATLGAVILVLLMACVNVMNLLLARGSQRRGEFAMRAALGARRSRMLRQLLTESLLLAALGGALGMVVAEFGIQAFLALSPSGLPRVNAIRFNGIVFAFGLGVSTVIGLLVGLIPALYGSRSDLHQEMQQSSQRTAGGHQFTRRTLVVAEFALALVLLVSAGLLLRSLQHLFAIDPGFDASHLVTMQVQTSAHRFDKDATHRFFDKALEAVRQVPGVSSAALTSQLPLSGDLDEYGVQFEPRPNGKVEGGNSAFRYAVTPGYFETVKIPLRRGRFLDTQDVANAPLAVVLSESLAKREFPDEDPIGKHLHIGPTDGPWYTVVGVVGDVKQASLAANQTEAVYVTTAQWRFVDNALSVVIRASGDPTAIVPAVRNAIWSVDKDQPIIRVAAMESLVAASAAERRFALILFEAFGLMALILAATGIYGVLSGSVNERIREIGVRSALGASRSNILALVVRQGMALTGIGVILGLAGSVVASQAILTLLFDVSRLDPVTYLGVVALLVGVSVVACWMPAWRAAGVDPSITLRSE